MENYIAVWLDVAYLLPIEKRNIGDIILKGTGVKII